MLTKGIMFAKDTKNGSDEDEFQHALNLIESWSSDNQFTINVSKWKIMKFAGETMEKVDSFKYLGITLDPKLYFGLNTADVTVRATRLVAASARLARYFGNKKMNPISFNIYIDPLLIYAAPAWAHCAQSKIDELATGSAPRVLSNYLPYPERLCSKHTYHAVTAHIYHRECWNENHEGGMQNHIEGGLVKFSLYTTTTRQKSAIVSGPCKNSTVQEGN